MRRKIGSISVDSGQVMITDPCYVLGDGGDYDKVCKVTLSKERAGGVDVGTGDAVVSGTAYGDGTYPVYANYDKHGVITSLTVKLV